MSCNLDGNVSMFRMVRLSLCLSGALLAQDFRAALAGRVTDPSGGVVPKATITLTNLDTSATLRTESTESGDFSVPTLPPGRYELKVEAPGFKTFIRSGITLAIQDRRIVDVQLEPGEVTTTITVSADASLLETAGASRGELISGKTLVDLPLNGRNVFALTTLAPGVAFTARGQASTFLRTTANLGISSLALSGGQPRMNEVLLDGVPVTGSDGLIQFVPSVDATQEFKVQINSFDAEYGRFTGGVINAMIKSGTNEFRGAVFEFVRNSAFNARDPFASAIPQFGYNLYGTAAGGPVILPTLYNGRNRTFWFFSYEASREGVPRAFVSTVPTLAQRAGDFSATAVRLPNGQPGPVTIYDPATTRLVANAYLRDPFPSNRIPATRFDPAARKLLDLYPPPNAPGDAINGANNFQLSFKDVTGDDGWVAKVDHRLSDRNSLFVRYSLRQWYVTRQGAFKNSVTGDRETRDAPGVAVDDTLVINPTTVLNVRYGFTRFLQQSRADSLGADLTALGFPAGWVSQLPVRALPQFSIAGFTTLGGATKLNRSAENVHTLRGTLNKVLSRHALKFGAEGRLLHSNTGNLGALSAGAFNFDAVFTRGPNPQVANIQAGHSLASFLLGLAASGSVNNPGAFADQMPYYGLFLQDDIRLNARLTLNLGLRYEWEGAYTERYNRLNRGFDFSTPSPIATQAQANYAQNPIPEVSPANFRVLGGLLFAGVGGQPRALTNIQRTNWAPRLGVAFQLLPETVLRAGYGIFYGASTLSAETRNGFSVSTPFVGSIDGGLTAVNVLSNPFPNGLNQPTGASQGLMTLVGQGVSFTDVNRSQPRAHQYSVSVQRQLPGRVLAEVAYVGSFTERVSVDRQINFIPAAIMAQAQEVFAASGRNILNDSVRSPFYNLIPSGPLAGMNIARGQLTRPYPHFTSIVDLAKPLGKIRYDSLQAKVNKRLSGGLSLLASLTWMKQLEQLRFLNDQDPKPVKELSAYDFGKSFTAGAGYELPFGPGRVWGSAGRAWTRALLSGWQLNVIYMAQGGPPVLVSGAQSVGRSARLSSDRKPQRWFDASAFRQLQTLEYVATSTLPDVRAAGRNNVDLSVLKTTTIRENWKLQFRAESFNTFNRPEWSSPGGVFGQPNFGVVTSTNTFMRQLQFGLKLLW